MLIICGATWSADDGAARVSANRAWLQELYDRLREHSPGQAYQNLIDPQLSDWAQAYYGSNLARLSRIKRRYDPDDLFHFAQGIPLGS
jgi:FAD/FMN-containing dehydrogenase